MTITEMVHEAFSTAKSKGFHEGDENIPEKLALIHAEVSEALECLRAGEIATTTSPTGKPEGFDVELADVVIRVADLAGMLNINLEKAIQIKMEYNRSRPYKHGKNF